MALKDDLDKARKRLMNQAGGAIDNLAAVATDLTMKETAAGLKGVRERLQSETFDLIVAGRFKNGKSTLLNALLGQLTHPVAELEPGQGFMPVDPDPCTATLTRIRYADKPYVRVWKFNGTYEEWPLARYLRDSTIRTDEEETQKFFGNIREFELAIPVELCQSGITLIDSPGTSDVPQRTAVTRDAVQHCDAAIVVYRSDVLAGEDERAFTSNEVLGTGTRVFTVINLMYGTQLNDRRKAFIWNRLVKDLRGESAYTGQDFTAHDIYFVDALKAQAGKLTNNPQLLAESGLALLEQQLARFLLNDRHRTHMEKFLRRAESFATNMDQMIGQRRAALQTDEEKLQQAYQAIQPQLVTIRTRRERLPRLFERYRKECQRELQASFEQTIARLRQDLPDALKRRPLPSMESTVGALSSPFRQKKVCGEAANICNAIIEERLTAWSNNPPERPGAQQALAPIIERLFDEIRDEITGIERLFALIHFQLTGWKPQTDTPAGIVGMQERILSGLAGLVVGDFSSILGAGGMGWRGVAGNLVGQVTAAVGLTLLGVGGATIFLPAVLAAGIIGSILWGTAGLENRVKNRVLAEIDKGLQTAPSQAADQIDQEVKKMFDQLETEITKEVLAVINEEEQNIRKLLELNKRGRAEKAQSLGVLDNASRKMATLRQALKDSMVQLQQTV